MPAPRTYPDALEEIRAPRLRVRPSDRAGEAEERGHRAKRERDAADAHREHADEIDPDADRGRGRDRDRDDRVDDERTEPVEERSRIRVVTIITRMRKLSQVRARNGGKHRPTTFGFAGCLALSVIAAGLGMPAVGSAMDAGSSEGLRGPYTQRTLTLKVPKKLEVGKRVNVRAEGTAGARDEVSVFVDPKGKKCPATAAALPARAIPLLTETVNEGPFGFKRTYRPARPRDRSFCGYLGASQDQAFVRASARRIVLTRHLRGSVARRTVVTALKRHNFAKRVVKSVERSCHRRSRDAFSCKFSSTFPGYRLKGRGRVQLGIDLSYRFRVKAQGVRLTLTDENEERRTN